MLWKNMTAAVVAASVLLGFSSASAQVANPSKIAFINYEKAIVNIAEGKAKLEALQEWLKPWQQRLQKATQEVADLQARVNNTTDENTLAQLTQELKTKQRGLEDMQRTGKREFEEKRADILKEVGEKLNQVIKGYADANEYTAVMILRPNDVVYLASSADITDSIIKLYDLKHPYPPPKGTAGN
jgi:outer membrane protein